MTAKTDKLDHHFSEIETPQFAAQVGLASDLDMFIEIAESAPTIQALKQSLEDVESHQRVVARIEALLKMPVDSNYGHPYDSAIAVYLLALRSVRDQSAARIAPQVANCEECWWSRMVANRIVDESKNRAHSNLLIMFGRPEFDFDGRDATVDSIDVPVCGLGGFGIGHVRASIHLDDFLLREQFVPSAQSFGDSVDTHTGDRAWNWQMDPRLELIND